jgi:hypothetical protein
MRTLEKNIIVSTMLGDVIIVGGELSLSFVAPIEPVVQEATRGSTSLFSCVILPRYGDTRYGL